MTLAGQVSDDAHTRVDALNISKRAWNTYPPSNSPWRPRCLHGGAGFDASESAEIEDAFAVHGRNREAAPPLVDFEHSPRVCRATTQQNLGGAPRE